MQGTSPLRRARLVMVAAGTLLAVGVLAVPAPAGESEPFHTSQPAMLTPLASGATVEPLMTVGETLPSGYRLESVPDGIALDTSNGSVDVYLNHEASLVPFPYNAATGVGETDFTNAMVSELKLSRNGGGVLGGKLVIPSSANFQRFCSSFLAIAGEGNNGFERSLLFTNEEANDFVNRTGASWPARPGAEQAGVAVAYDVETGAFRPIYGMGRLNHENSVAVPGYDRPVLVTGDDTFSAPSSQLYMYRAENAAGVWNDQGTLWAFKSDDPTVNDYSDLSGSDEVSGHYIPVPQSVALGDQAGLESWSNANDVFQFIRVEDITFDRNSPNVLYFADTGDPRALPGPTDTARMSRGPSGTRGPFPNGRVFKMVLSPSDPTKVLSLSILVEGDPIGAASAKDLRFIHNPDNVETTGRSLLILEDPTSINGYAPNDPNGTTARVWRYDLATHALTIVAKVDQSRDPAAKLGDWESSGIIDASSVFGAGAFLIDVQAHTLWVDKQQVGGMTYKREGGQLLLFRLPGA
jgi:hypothetical protein